jgi:hypothetical protein
VIGAWQSQEQSCGLLDEGLKGVMVSDDPAEQKVHDGALFVRQLDEWSSFASSGIVEQMRILMDWMSQQQTA